MNRRGGFPLRGALLAAGAALLVMLAASWIMRPGGTGDVDAESSESPAFGDLVAFLAEPPEKGFAEVRPGQPIRFPRDHGAHPEFRQEWWYFTGQLHAANGRRFGYQLTFFRFAAGSMPEAPRSAWAADQSWMAHLAITDVSGGRFLRDEDFARGTLELAGATGEPFDVWVNGWSVRALPEVPGCAGCFRATLAASGEGMELALELDASHPPVLQGEAGYSVKSADGRVASYYYSMPGMATRGSLRLDGELHAVEGETWMDREWSSAVLSPGQSGWDWFSLNLDNGYKLMIFRVREDGSPDFLSASLLDPEGRQLGADSAGIILEPVDYWTSGETGIRYPMAWEISGVAPEGPWSLELGAVIPEQEMALAFRYYEGLVDVAGQWGSDPVGGWGYLELTGYSIP